MFVRSLFIIVSIMVGLGVGLQFGNGSHTYILLGGIFMLSFSLGLIWIERQVFTFRPVETIGAFIGLSIGLCLSGITTLVIQQILTSSPELTSLFTIATLLGFCYIGTMIGLRLSRTYFLEPSKTHRLTPSTKAKILDTSAIIDGRIANLCQTGFFEGPLIVPQCVLGELQRIADSSDNHKRVRGKRGLDVLQELKNMEGIDVHITDTDFPEITEVDPKLVELAKLYQAKIVTTDMNLNKVATVQGIQILNTNELSNAIRPVVLPGESLEVFLLREGKEAGQGVAHLDDGTMVVVDHAQRWIGKHVKVVVTSVIQTNAGRMIFSSLRQNTPRLQANFG